MQAQQPHNLHIEIDNPAGEIVPSMSSRINQDDWLPNLTVQDPGEAAVTILKSTRVFSYSSLSTTLAVIFKEAQEKLEDWI